MNRRDFVKALAGIPLLGLLVKVPKVPQPTLAEAYIKDLVDAGSQPATLSFDGDYCYIGDKEPYLPIPRERFFLAPSLFLPYK